jgi:hypothetical protein
VDTACPPVDTACPPLATHCPLADAKLVVQSTPVVGVDITGTVAGTTNYSATVAICPVTEVSLTAPSAVASGGLEYVLIRWTVNGVEQPAGEATVTFAMTADTTAVAAYATGYHLSLKAGGWNLVSLPNEPANPAPASVFGPNLLDVYAWWTGGIGTYIVPIEIEAKRGYWVAVRADTEIDILGSLPPTSTVHVVPGWNLVGPRNDTALPAGVLAVYGWEWPGGLPRYVVPTQCLKGHGYWVAPSAEMDIW